jgi:hypothetical protein
VTSPSRLGAILVVLGGLAVVVGSYWAWDSCPKEPCEGPGGLFHIYSRSGIEAGPGLVTVVLGVALVVLGLGSLLWWAESRWPAAVSIVLSGGVILVLAGYMVRVRLVPEYPVIGLPGLGLIVVVLGAVMATIGGLLGLRAARRTPT